MTSGVSQRGFVPRWGRGGRVQLHWEGGSVAGCLAAGARLGGTRARTCGAHRRQERRRVGAPHGPACPRPPVGSRAPPPHLARSVLVARRRRGAAAGDRAASLYSSCCCLMDVLVRYWDTILEEIHPRATRLGPLFRPFLDILPRPVADAAAVGAG
jgi:hypothetical protein